MNDNTVYTYFEHQRITESSLKYASDFHWLLAKVETEQAPCFKLGLYSGKLVLVVRHYLAVITLPSGSTLEILPKISKQSISSQKNTNLSTEDKALQAQNQILVARQWVTKMLTDVYDIKKSILPLLSSHVSHSNQDNQSQQAPPKKILSNNTWFQPIIKQWFQLLLTLDFPRHYQQHQQNTPKSQGKLLVKQQLKHNNHRPHYRYTVHNKLQKQSLWLQFLYSAIIQLQFMGITIPSNITQLFELAFIQVSIDPMRRQLTPQLWQDIYQQLSSKISNLGFSDIAHSNNNQQALSNALEIAWLILQLQKLNTNLPVISSSDKKNTFPAVIINMHQAFEKWVSTVVELTMTHISSITELPTTEPSKKKIKHQVESVWLAQHDKNLNNQVGEVNQHTRKQLLTVTRKLRPDVLIENINNAMIEVVADIKYKYIETPQDVTPSDLYQLNTYQQHWQARQAWLIFPANEQFKQPIKLKKVANNQLLFSKNVINNVSNNEIVDEIDILIIPFDTIKGCLILSKNY